MAETQNFYGNLVSIYQYIINYQHDTKKIKKLIKLFHIYIIYIY